MRKILGVCVVVLLAMPVVSSADAAPPFLLMWGSDGFEIGQLPKGYIRFLALDQDENVYVPSKTSPTFEPRIQVFDSDGRFLRQFLTHPGGTLMGIAIDSQGDIVVANKDCERVEKYDNQGNFLRMWGQGVEDGSSAFQICTSGCQCGIAGAGDGHLSDPWGLVTDADGNVYVAERGNSRITKYDSLGNFLSTWGWGVQDGTAAFQVCTTGCRAGISGEGNGQFDLPNDIDVLGETVYVAEWNNNRVEVFSRDGAYQRQSDVSSAPAGVSVSPDGDLYVTSYWGYRVVKLDSSGTQVASWGVNGTGIGEFDNPLGIGVAPSGNVYVLDMENSRVQKFGPALRSFKAELQNSTNPLIAFPF